ncbi:PGPGW domain-containing protein [Methylophaga sp.]|uniref:PGPGW domain-containing protein n=1 Tax=Methylophaga sp. TaxID=2024840 RepID=UPI003F6A1EAB
MEHFSFQALFDFIWGNDTILLWLGLISLFSFLASLFLIPYLVVRIPVDYFAEGERQPSRWAEEHIVLRWFLLLVRNVFGMIFIVLGLAMLLLPGQGILTMFVGILLLNFPGKYQFERRLIQLPAINRGIGWLRRRAGREPLIF